MASDQAAVLNDQELLEAAIRPMGRPGRGFWIVAGIAAALALVGTVAYGIQLVNGLSVTGYNDRVFWALYEATLVTFIGFSYGGALVSAILRLVGASWRGRVTRIAEVSALATLLVGALYPIIHLGRPDRVLEIIFQPNFQSPIVWDMYAIFTYILATLVLLALPLIPDFAAVKDHPAVGRRRGRLYRALSFGWRGLPSQRQALNRALTVVAILIVPLAVIVHTVLSYAFSLTSRPGWHSTIFGPYFVIGAVYSGVAIVILAALAYRSAYRLHAWIDDRVLRYLGYILVALAVAYGYSTFTELTTAGYVGQAADANILYSLIFTDYALAFWGFVAFGLLVPILLVAVPRLRTGLGLGIASVCVVVAMLLKRFLIIVPPEAQPLIGLEQGTYTPSLVELAVVGGGIGGIILIMLVLFRVVPVLSINEIQELEGPAEVEETEPAVAVGVGA